MHMHLGIIEEHRPNSVFHPLQFWLSHCFMVEVLGDLAGMGTHTWGQNGFPEPHLII